MNESKQEAPLRGACAVVRKECKLHCGRSEAGGRRRLRRRRNLGGLLEARKCVAIPYQLGNKRRWEANGMVYSRRRLRSSALCYVRGHPHSRATDDE